MTGITLLTVVSIITFSMAATAMLCRSIVTRDRIEARRERFGLQPGKAPWP